MDVPQKKLSLLSYPMLGYIDILGSSRSMAFVCIHACVYTHAHMHTHSALMLRLVVDVRAFIHAFSYKFIANCD